MSEVKDAAEQGVKLSSDFITSSRNEDRDDVPSLRKKITSRKKIVLCFTFVLKKNKTLNEYLLIVYFFKRKKNFK